MISLVADPDAAVPFLRDQLGPPTDLKRIPQWILDLRSKDFQTRRAARRHIEEHGLAALPSLRDALTKREFLEVWEMCYRVSQEIEANATEEEFWLLRSVDVLEHIRTPEARKLLATIAQGGYGESAASFAGAALRRVRATATAAP
jgi:hypothetical protein